MLIDIFLMKTLTPPGPAVFAYRILLGLLVYAAATSSLMTHSARAEPSALPPDLTQSNQVDRELTYNLGATGLRGWIYSKPASHFDGLQGRTTAASRQILVTHVGKKSPADGVVQVNDVILGVASQPFNDDARKSLAMAIGKAEQEANRGLLTLTCWRDGAAREVQITLKPLGTYSATAPYDCPKSKQIFTAACQSLEQEELHESWNGAVTGLALLATGNPAYLPRLKEFAHKIGPATLKLQLRDGMVMWDWGYKNLFLSEYYLATGDKDVLPAIREYTVSLAKGQGLYGTFGHGIAPPTADGKLHGSIPPYGPVNAAGLVGNIAIVMGKKCGVSDPEIDPAIERASNFFGYYVDKGSIPYGEHEPWPYHENNGKNAMSAVLFATQEVRPVETQFFAQMVAAGYANRESGHTGQGFSYLWGALGAAAGGPAVAAAFFKEAAWHFDLVRRSDGSFTYDGGEQYGPGKTDDNTYYGKSGYYGLSPTASYVLTYSLPLKKLCLTGRDAKQSHWLSEKKIPETIAAGRFDVDRKTKTPTELVSAFGNWSPIVRSWAAEELARRPEAKAMVPQLIEMAKGSDVHAAQAACESLGLIKSAEALPALTSLLAHKDRWLRFKAAKALRDMNAEAKPAIPTILKAVAETAEPLQPIVWADPIQLTHGQLAAALFQGPLADSLKDADRSLLYPAIQAISTNADGMARATLRNFFEHRLTAEDVQSLAPDIIAAVETPSPADRMFANEIRMGGFKALTKYHFKEGLAAGIELAKTQGGHGSERRTGEIMQEIVGYGTAAREVLPQLKELIVQFNEQCRNREFPDDCNQMRVTSVKEAIQSIEAATTQPELRSVTPAKPVSEATSADLTFPAESIDQWHGHKRHVFQWQGASAWVVEPKQSLPGRPWSWCMMFPDAFTARCAAPQLLDAGFHHAFIDVGNTFGSPAAIEQLAAFHAELVRRGLAPKAALIGISRGGLYAHRFAAEHPEKVSVIYGDAAVSDFKSWPGGKGKGTGSGGDWQAMLKAYGFADDAAAMAYGGNPVDALAPLAEAKIPLIHVVGDADTVVPPAENALLIAERYKPLGGTIELIHKPGVGHHPHGLADPQPVVDFIVRHSSIKP